MADKKPNKNQKSMEETLWDSANNPTSRYVTTRVDI